jgi:hypothetical protein
MFTNISLLRGNKLDVFTRETFPAEKWRSGVKHGDIVNPHLSPFSGQNRSHRTATGNVTLPTRLFIILSKQCVDLLNSLKILSSLLSFFSSILFSLILQNDEINERQQSCEDAESS